MREFWRKNKLLLQFLAATATFLGLEPWESIQAGANWFRGNRFVHDTLLNWAWWSADVWEVPFGRIFLVAILLGIVFNASFSIRFRSRPVTRPVSDLGRPPPATRSRALR